MWIFYRLLLAVSLVTCSVSIFANDELLVPYEVRAEFRASGCETITVHEAASTDLGRQKIYVATCSGIDRYLLAVKCRGTNCQTLR